MMDQIDILGWTVEVDRDTTQAVYLALPPIGCDCLYCRNYLAACRQLPPAMLHLLALFGIDPAKEGEVSELQSNGDGTHLYYGFYHLVGRIVTEPRSAGTPDSRTRAPSLLADNLEVWFTSSLSLVPEGFPPPVLQLEFSGDIPWVLQEQP